MDLTSADRALAAGIAAAHPFDADLLSRGHDAAFRDDRPFAVSGRNGGDPFELLLERSIAADEAAGIDGVFLRAADRDRTPARDVVGLRAQEQCALAAELVGSAR